MTVIVQELEAELAPQPAEADARAAPPDDAAPDPRPILVALARDLWRARRLLAD